MHRSANPPPRRYVRPVLAVLLLLAHGGVVYRASPWIRPAGMITVGALLLFGLAHLGALRSFHALLRRRRSTRAAPT
jgi:hypothetical protein